VLDQAWYLAVDPAIRHKRLLARHMRFGRSEAAAMSWIEQTDEPNARRIEGTRHRADWVIAE